MTRNINQPIFRFPLTLLGGAIVLGVLGGCASSGGGGSPVAPLESPFYSAQAKANIQINTLRVFGDSYSAFQNTIPWGTKNWSSELAGSVSTNSLDNYAFGGARAATVGTNNFQQQINASNRSGKAFSEKDLTVVYFGYNDIGRAGGDLGAPKAGYLDGLSRLTSQGAASGSNRIFVTQIHDWSRNPGVSRAATQGLVADWVNFVGGVANTNPNIIAVDLFTVFNRVMDNPDQFGLVNVTDPDPARSATDYLFFNDVHFGSRGQEIIARTYYHYLTRGWNWAGAVNAGSLAAVRLNRDISSGVLRLNAQNSNPLQQGLRVTTLGQQNNSPASTPTAYQHLAFVQGSPTQFEQTAPKGMAFDIPLQSLGIQSSGHVGVALANDAQPLALQDAEGDRFNSQQQTQSTAAYWMQPHGNFHYSTILSYNQHQYNQTGHDKLLGRAINNTRSGSTVGLEGTLRYTLGYSLGKFTPFMSLGQQAHTLNAATFSSLYTSNVHYGQTTASDTYSTVGVDFDLTQPQFSGRQRLSLGGSFQHTQFINRDEIMVRMVESINPSLRMGEVIPRMRLNKTEFSMTARYHASRFLRFDTTYYIDASDRKQDQGIKFTASIPIGSR